MQKTLGRNGVFTLMAAPKALKVFVRSFPV